MKIYNVEEHLNCYCYDNGKLQRPLVYMLNIKRYEENEFTSSDNGILFVLKGNIYFSLNNNESIEVQKEQFIFLHAGSKVRYKASTSSQALIVSMTEHINLCHVYSIEQLYKEMINVEKPEGLVVLDTNPRLQYSIVGLADTWSDGLKCRHFIIAETTKILTMMRVYYSKEDLCRFFYHVLSPDTAFSEYVRMHHLQYRSVKELAKSMNMSSQQFSRRFAAIFNKPPYEWMLQEKARLIYSEICTSEKPYKEIAADFGFSLQENFIRFCRTAFGAIPSEIRKREREKITKNCIIKK